MESNNNSDSSLQWDRVFELSAELGGLEEDEVEERLRKLREDGEGEQVLARVRIRLLLPPNPEPSERLPLDSIVGGEYRIVGHLGSGGMGIVYEAVLEKTGKTVALKMIHPNLVVDDSRERFFREMKVLGRLEHPGIVSILHAGSHTGAGGEVSEYFTMERVVGASLRDYLKSDEATVSERLRIIRDLAIAVEYAHDRDVIHRDLKPANMMVQADGLVKIFDFGLAAAVFLNEDGKRPAVVGGTPPYMAPEQALAETTSPTADVYSLGAILYEILLGKPIYEVDQRAPYASKLEQMRNPPPPPIPFSEAPELAGEILKKALDPAPENRHQSAAEFARALNRLLPAHLVHDPPHQWHPAAGLVVPATDWVLEERLGEGAHGQVWLARNRPVVISDEPLIPPPRVYKFCDSERAARALRREVRVFHGLRSAAGGKHDLRGVVPIESWSLDQPPYYIAMRHLEGALDLRDWMESKELSEETALAIICDVAKALEFSHGIGVLHRDVKPGNILVREDSEAPGGVRAWLVDFGLASFDEELWKSVIAKSISTREDYEKFVGTPEYIAPEIRSSGYTTRSDIYSLGVVAYRLLSGNLAATLNDWKERISDPLLRDDLEMCLSDDPEERFDSAGALEARLGEIPRRREETEIARRHGIEAKAAREAELEKASKTAYRLGILRTSAISAVVVALLGFLAWFSYQNYQESKRSESRVRLAEIQALRQSSRPGNFREILVRIEAVHDEHPEEHVPLLRNEALSVLSFPVPYGGRIQEIGKIPPEALIDFQADWVAWHWDGEMHVAQLSESGLISREPIKHGNELTQIKVSSDGKLTAILTTDGQLQVIDESGAVEIIRGEFATGGLDVHATGYIAAAGRGGRLHLFEKKELGWSGLHQLGAKPPEFAGTFADQASIGAPLREIIASAESIEFSPDARYVAIGGSTSLEIRIWNVKSGELVCRCPHASPPDDLKWDTSISGRLWTTAAGSVYGWAMRGGMLGAELSPVFQRPATLLDEPYHQMETSPDGAYLVCTEDDGGKMFLWREGLDLKEVRASSDSLKCGYLPSGEFWTLASDGTIRLNIDDLRLAEVWTGGKGAVQRMALSRDLRLVAATCGSDVVVRSPSDFGSVLHLPARARGLGIAFSQSEKKLFSTGVTGMNIWEWEEEGFTAKFKPPFENDGYGHGGEALALLINDISWIALSNGSMLNVLCKETGADWPVFRKGEGPTVTGLATGSGTPWFAVSRGGSATLICYPESGLKQELPPAASDVLGIASNYGGSRLVERTAETVHVKDPVNLTELAKFSLPLAPPDLRTMPVHSAPVAISDDASLVAATTTRSRVVLFHIGQEEPVAELPLPQRSVPTSLIFTPAGDLLVGTADGQQWFWRLPAIREELRRMGIDWEPAAGKSAAPAILNPVYGGS